jgi:hypothetical protein
LERRQWVNWRYAYRESDFKRVPSRDCRTGRLPDKKPGKAPINPKTGRFASTRRRMTWGWGWEAFDRCWAAGGPPVDGVAFVVAGRDRLVGIDLDDVFDGGERQARARDVVRRLNSYTELSPGGRGLRVLVRARLPPGGGFNKGRGLGLEVYGPGHCFTLTGHRLPGTPAGLMGRQAALEEIYREFAPEKLAPPLADCSPGLQPWGRLEDDVLLRRARAARNGRRFSRLWDGDWEGDYDSHSEADFALLLHLAHWTGRDAGRMDALFRQSALYRAKWDRPGRRGTYGALRVQKALARYRDYSDQAPTTPIFLPDVSGNVHPLKTGTPEGVRREGCGAEGGKVGAARLLALAGEAAGVAVPGLDLGFRGDGYGRLAALSLLLSREVGGGEFFLGQVEAGGLVGAAPRVAGRWLGQLCADGWLELVQEGDRAAGRAAAYRWVGG